MLYELINYIPTNENYSNKLIEFSFKFKNYEVEKYLVKDDYGKLISRLIISGYNESHEKISEDCQDYMWYYPIYLIFNDNIPTIIGQTGPGVSILSPFYEKIDVPPNPLCMNDKETYHWIWRRHCIFGANCIWYDNQSIQFYFHERGSMEEQIFTLRYKHQQQLDSSLLNPYWKNLNNMYEISQVSFDKFTSDQINLFEKGYHVHPDNRNLYSLCEFDTKDYFLNNDGKRRNVAKRLGNLTFNGKLIEFERICTHTYEITNTTKIIDRNDILYTNIYNISNKFFTII